jgi:hypothetical protein
MQVNVQTSPTPKLPGLLGGHVLRLGIDEAPDFVHLEALAGEVAERLILVGNARLPDLPPQLMKVSFETPAMRAIARMPQPSTRADTIWTRFGVLSTFAILDIMRKRLGIVKQFGVQWVRFLGFSDSGVRGFSPSFAHHEIMIPRRS